MLTIIANDFPSRQVNLEERKEAISQAFYTTLKEAGLTGIKVGVWVLLAPAAWDETYIPYPDEA